MTRRSRLGRLPAGLAVMVALLALALPTAAAAEA